MQLSSLDYHAAMTPQPKDGGGSGSTPHNRFKSRSPNRVSRRFHNPLALEKTRSCRASNENPEKSLASKSQEDRLLKRLSKDESISHDHRDDESIEAESSDQNSTLKWTDKYGSRDNFGRLENNVDDLAGIHPSYSAKSKRNTLTPGDGYLPQFASYTVKSASYESTTVNSVEVDVTPSIDTEAGVLTSNSSSYPSNALCSPEEVFSRRSSTESRENNKICISGENNRKRKLDDDRLIYKPQSHRETEGSVVKTGRLHRKQGPLFACPFLKRDPIKYVCCQQLKLRGINRVK
jgi:hypothetical protein